MFVISVKYFLHIALFPPGPQLHVYILIMFTLVKGQPLEEDAKMQASCKQQSDGCKLPLASTLRAEKRIEYLGLVSM